MRKRRNWLFGFVLLWLACSTSLFGADAGHCAVCNASFGNVVYTILDKATHEKVFICYSCAISPDECYICGLPVKVNYTKLSDGRFLCERDGRTAIVDADEAQQVSEEVRRKLDRLFSRFLTFPSANVKVALVDRVDLYDEFTVMGNDFECPDVLGYIKSNTNRNHLEHSISLMTGLPRAAFQATCAHEYAHAWVFENVSSERRRSISREAHEGFCELVAYLLMDSLHEEAQKDLMLENNYTRGQIDLFIAAEKKHGFNDVIDWVQWGVNPRLKEANLDDIRNVEMPRAKAMAESFFPKYAAVTATVPDKLQLKGISFSTNRPLALINDQSFVMGESAKVRVAGTNVLIRCLSVGERSVRIRFVDSGKDAELFLKGAAEKGGVP
jgi:hypothetical protein